MSGLTDILKFNNFFTRDNLDKIKKNPERLLLGGAADPLTAKVGSLITGKQYEPFINVGGGATQASKDRAEAAGINTKPYSKLHTAAQAVSAAYVGGSALGGTGAAGGADAGTSAAWANGAGLGGDTLGAVGGQTAGGLSAAPASLSAAPAAFNPAVDSQVANVGIQEAGGNALDGYLNNPTSPASEASQYSKSWKDWADEAQQMSQGNEKSSSAGDPQKDALAARAKQLRDEIEQIQARLNGGKSEVPLA